MNSKNVPATTKPQLPDAEGRISDLMAGLINIRNTIQETGGVATGMPFLSINADGVWGFGQDRIEVEADSQWAIDVRTWKHGYIAWPGQNAKERKPLGERMVPVSLPKPDINTLPDVGEPYAVQFSFELLCMSGQDAGTKVLYKNGSYGTKLAVADLVEKVEKQSLIDATKLCPVVALKIRAYFHPQYKRDVYNPILAVQKWITFEDFDNFEALEVVEAEAPAPAPEPQVAARGSGRRGPEPRPANRRPGGRTQPRA